ncbi:type VI secretion system baseplate subunit TssF [Myxococcus sp. K38C18041901]|uniref:type VI secretion system baseplate subunit TssF n=1 Tax=Myxococcus guangdongensis TaxID=2906760 RepID=UPI0020A7FB0B|nr:type VI secretion system baseplate subunit TssF [Myxococcus guangdongensis]MCP3064803.1 type VI secretion system baseplate subunit TssF [Myxococcus guangdongensis]
MGATTRLYQDYLAELAALERFRQEFRHTYPGVPLEQEDPDVRRMVEALAFFSVQTRHATLQNLRSTWTRLFSSYFQSLLEPRPAAGLVQAVPTEKMVEAVVLPRGTQLRLRPAGGEPGCFRLQSDLRVLPIFLEETRAVPLAGGGHRLILRFAAAFPRRDPVGVLGLHVRHLEDYASSLATHHALRQHLTRVSVVYDAKADERSTGLACEHSFERAPFDVDSRSTYENPLERARSFFQLPEQGLFLHVRVAPTLRAWSGFSLCLDLKKAWAGGLFHCFVAPVVNLEAAPAQPITLDGTRTEHPLLGARNERGVRLHSVTGVYLQGPRGREPLRPAQVPGAGPAYELETLSAPDGGPLHQVLVHMPAAFLEPRQLHVEALWYQPHFAAEATGPLEVTTPGVHVEGLRWRAVGDVQPARDSDVREDVTALVQLLSWKNRSTLERDELVALLSLLGASEPGALRPITPLLRALRVVALPGASARGTGLRHVYDALLEPFEAGLEPLVACWLEQVHALLDAWNGEAAVELRAEVAGAGPFEPWGRG